MCISLYVRCIDFLARVNLKMNSHVKNEIHA